MPGCRVDDIGAGRDIVSKEVRDVAEGAEGDGHGDLEADDPVDLKVVSSVYLPHSPDDAESERMGDNVICLDGNLDTDVPVQG